MDRMRKLIDRLNDLKSIAGIYNFLDVSNLGKRIAGDIEDLLRFKA